ncbi:hypothetical protein [Methylophilus sp.]|uniref:hypothetical protein n=1 Tax=Methylophilus sp. TaxID=29541 RepID=UPI000D4597E3|nr:hypothetical protein [Methylophilus sp.]PPD12148.1 MAG: hypothetical protein CTY26_06035 [Methylophilus sp.]
MTLGEKLKAILIARKLKQADLIRSMNAISPEIDISTLQGAIRLLIARKGSSSKYLPLIAKALSMTTDSLINWTPEKERLTEQTPSHYLQNWPFGSKVSPDEYESLEPEQKEAVISRILIYLDDNRIKRNTKSTYNKATN